ncbi:hypothetical protein FA15DRAFT_757735 [Coprinopsis marcescibilis]|uniref:Protein kinase domain-containing protein n=1 Tax=Coprinopsis marcescibilis TaxID=230819 RepID=A0A5C3KQH7_COPMA|nr:hypothetical protein FA15DRAFT_757735 [Coprinopsis marcescibilis]
MKTTQSPQETRVFLREQIASDPRNHCVRLIDTLRVPGDEAHESAVLPMLREFDLPEFDTVGEVVDFVKQVLEAFAFLHEHRVAQRDVRVENIMMDHTALGMERFHFIIDFGFSKQFTIDEMPPSELPLHTTDSMLPELENMGKPGNPFPSDVYYVGNMWKMDFITGFPEDIFRKDDRLTIQEAVEKFDNITA